MKTYEVIIWIDEKQRTIPGYGIFKKGSKSLLPIDMAKSLKRQGLVKIVKKKRRK